MAEYAITGEPAPRAICLLVGKIHITKIRDEAEFDDVVDNTMTVVQAPARPDPPAPHS